jgi:hypothetical protein
MPTPFPVHRSIYREIRLGLINEDWIAALFFVPYDDPVSKPISILVSDQ